MTPKDLEQGMGYLIALMFELRVEAALLRISEHGDLRLTAINKGDESFPAVLAAFAPREAGL